MNMGIWVWPSDPKAQRKVLRQLTLAQHLVPAMAALAKSKEGLSNAELDDAIGDNSNWMTLWVVRQLTSLGFVEFKVDYFGGPARYQLSDLGRNVLSTVAGQTIPKAPAHSAIPQPVAQKAA